MRFGIALLDLKLPSEVWKTITQESIDSASEIVIPLNILGGVIRRGIVSIIPEVFCLILIITSFNFFVIQNGLFCFDYSSLEEFVCLHCPLVSFKLLRQIGSESDIDISIDLNIHFEVSLLNIFIFY